MSYSKYESWGSQSLAERDNPTTPKEPPLSEDLKKQSQSLAERDNPTTEVCAMLRELKFASRNPSLRGITLQQT